MCFNKSALINIQKLKNPYRIPLPNGQQTDGHEYGSVVLAESVILHHVLYFPLFKFNLLSIAKLCRQLRSFVVFFRKILFLVVGPFLEEAFGS